jgi:hypothetical protein
MRVNRFSTATEQEECLEIDGKGQRLRWGDERLMIDTAKNEETCENLERKHEKD